MARPKREASSLNGQPPRGTWTLGHLDLDLDDAPARARAINGNGDSDGARGDRATAFLSAAHSRPSARL
jgi:hypothetical protein